MLPNGPSGAEPESSPLVPQGGVEPLVSTLSEWRPSVGRPGHRARVTGGRVDPVVHRFPGWSGEWGSNPQPSAWQADALPIELLPQGARGPSIWAIRPIMGAAGIYSRALRAMEPRAGFTPACCSIPSLQGPRRIGAGSQNRTDVARLEIWGFAIKLYPHCLVERERIELSHHDLQSCALPLRYRSYRAGWDSNPRGACAHRIKSPVSSATRYTDPSLLGQFLKAAAAKHRQNLLNALFWWRERESNSRNPAYETRLRTNTLPAVIV